jgi:hypothetical protein
MYQTRDGIPDRAKLGIPSHFEAAREHMYSGRTAWATKMGDHLRTGNLAVFYRTGPLFPCYYAGEGRVEREDSCCDQYRAVEMQSKL